MYKTRTTSSKKYLFIVLPLLAVLGISIFYFTLKDDQPNTNSTVNQVSYSEPTEEEQKIGEVQKQSNQEREKIDSKSVDSAKQSSADIVLVDAGQYENVIEVRAYIANVYADNGTCTVEFTQAGYAPVSKTSNAFKDAKTTQCGKLHIPRSEFNANGTWNLKLSYTSPEINGILTKDIVVK